MIRGWDLFCFVLYICLVRITTHWCMKFDVLSWCVKMVHRFTHSKCGLFYSESMTCCVEDQMQSLFDEKLSMVANIARSPINSPIKCVCLKNINYFETESYIMIQQHWRNRYTGNWVPSKPSIYHMKYNFVTHGTVVNRNKNGRGRPWSGRSPVNITSVQRELHQ